MEAECHWSAIVSFPLVYMAAEEIAHWQSMLRHGGGTKQLHPVLAHEILT